MFRRFVLCALLTVTCLPTITSSLKCLQCASFGGSSEACDAGTIEATDCTKGDVCVSYYLRLAKTLTRDCIPSDKYVATLSGLGQSEKCTTDGCNQMKAGIGRHHPLSLLTIIIAVIVVRNSRLF